MQVSMSDNRPWMPCHNTDQLEPTYLMMTSQLLQRSSETVLTRNSSNFHESQGIHLQDQFVDHCSMWRTWRGSDHSALVQPHGLIEKRGQLVHGSYFVKTKQEALVQARMGKNLPGAETIGYSSGVSPEAGHLNGFCRREISSCTSSQIPQCQAEGCNQNLSRAKQYHRRHKVCELHSKASAVIVCGVIQRFCQQCSR